MAPNPQLINYIVQYTNLGYSPQSIKQSLLQSGYTPVQIDEAFSVVSKSHYGSVRQQGPNVTTPNLAIIGMLVIGVLLLALGGGLLFQSLNPTSISEPRSDVPISLEPVRTPTQPQQPQTQPSQTPRTTSQPPTSPQTPTSAQTQPVSTASFDSSAQLSRLQIDQQVDALKATRPQDAIALCKKIDRVAGEYGCYAKVALASKSPSYCELILDAESKDGCYVSLAIQTIGDSSLCAKISNEYKQRSCVELYNIDQTLEFVEPVEQSLPAFATESSVDFYTIE